MRLLRLCVDQLETPDSSATKRLSESHQHLLPKRQARPLSHLYNPHSRSHDRVEAVDHADLAGPARLVIQTYGTYSSHRAHHWSWARDWVSMDASL